MNFNCGKCSIQWMLIAIIVSCFAYAVYCNTDPKMNTTTAATATYTLLEDNPLYVQNFVSRMMSKYPFNASSVTLRDYTGMELRPNLGFEPYWEDFPDFTWAHKCARCPELYRKYTSVCALDSTGEKAFNMSLCDVIRLNCLNGEATGRSTGILNDFQDQYFAVKEGWVHVSIRQFEDAVIQLSAQPSNTIGDKYTILIDGWNGNWSAMYRNERVIAWYNNKGYRTLWNKEFVDFVIRWEISSGWFLITVASATDWTKAFHFNVTDPYPFLINFIAVGGRNVQPGDWKLKGFLVSSLSPCGPGAAQPLVTSPTEVSVLMRSFSQINKNYFSRVMEKGLDHDVSFLTREEY